MSPIEDPTDHDPDQMRALRSLARWMDEAVRIPGTSMRVGLDALLGLLPGVGDLAGGLVSASFLVGAVRLGAPPVLVVRMALNVALDALVGAVPLLGDVFDFGWKANRKNLALLERHRADPAGIRRSSRTVLVGAIAAAALVIGLALAGAIWVAAALWRWALA